MAALQRTISIVPPTVPPRLDSPESSARLRCPWREEHKGLPILAFASQTKFRVWLRRHHKRDDGLWVMFAKKNSGVTTTTYVEAREEAIAWGWIDGLKNGYGETYYLLRFTPRHRPRRGRFTPR